MAKVIKYIHGNPVRKGLVEVPEQWFYSSAAVWEQLRTEPLKIDREEWPTL